MPTTTGQRHTPECIIRTGQREGDCIHRTNTNGFAEVASVLRELLAALNKTQRGARQHLDGPLRLLDHAATVRIPHGKQRVLPLERMAQNELSIVRLQRRLENLVRPWCLVADDPRCLARQTKRDPGGVRGAHEARATTGDAVELRRGLGPLDVHDHFGRGGEPT